MVKKNLFHVVQDLLLVRNNNKTPRAQNPWRNSTVEKRGEIGDTVSQTVETKNTNRTQCSTLTLRPTFWGRNVTISVGRTIRVVLGLNVTWSERF